MLSLLAMIVTTGSISISFVTPMDGATVTGELDVAVRVISQLDIRDVQAELGGRTVMLTPALQLVTFSGKLDTDGLARGAHPLKVTVHDVEGLEAFDTIDIDLDSPPVLEVMEPAVDLVARGNFTVRARCFDDFAAGCRMAVRIEDPLRPLADRVVARTTGESTVTLPFCVAGYDGRRLSLEITATDGKQLTSRATREVFVELSEALAPKVVAPGRILDHAGARLLFRAENHDAFLNEGGEPLRLGPTDLACSCFGAGCDDCRDFGRLSETGAIIHSPSDAGPRLFESNGPVSEDLGPYRPQLAKVRGHFALWNDGRTLIRRDLRLGLNEPIAGPSFGDVDPQSGALVVKSGSTVCRLEVPDGGCNAVVSGALFGEPLIDGDDIAVQLHPNVVALFTDAGRTTFNDADRPVLRNGWLAFAQGGQVKVRRPEGGAVLVAGAESGSPEQLAPNGELTWIRDDGRRFLFVPDAGSREISSLLGRAVWDGEWGLLIGNTRFAVLADAGVGTREVECRSEPLPPRELGPPVPCGCSSGAGLMGLAALVLSRGRRALPNRGSSSRANG